MRTIIAGSRSVGNMQHVEDAIALSGFEITEVVSGCARGVDILGEKWASLHNIAVTRHPAEWGKYGLGAGYKRNRDMAYYAEALIAIWDGKSRGTKNMIDVATKLGLKVYVHGVE